MEQREYPWICYNFNLYNLSLIKFNSIFSLLQDGYAPVYIIQDRMLLKKKTIPLFLFPRGKSGGGGTFTLLIPVQKIRSTHPSVSKCSNPGLLLHLFLHFFPIFPIFQSLCTYLQISWKFFQHHFFDHKFLNNKPLKIRGWRRSY